MLGFMIGALSLIALVHTLRGGRYARGYRMGGRACGHGYGGGYGPPMGGAPFGYGGMPNGEPGGFEDDMSFARWAPPWARRGRFRRAMMQRLFSRLETTHGQEKELREAFGDLFERARAAKSTLGEARRGYADALRQESFDEVTLGTATAKLEEASEALRLAMIDAFAKVHGALDERQRKILADLLESGPGGRLVSVAPTAKVAVSRRGRCDMRRQVAIFVFGLGTILGFGSGFRSLHRARMHRESFERHVAKVCVDAARAAQTGDDSDIDLR